jgi:CubicO group peptidase (beta-lactamase class C family)
VGELREAVDEVAGRTGFGGVVRVDRAGETVLDTAFGLADRAHRIPMTTGTRLAIASGSKVFTALAVMALVEREVLGLGATARSLLGADLPLVADDVTVEHLLAHRSGIGDYVDEELDLPVDHHWLKVPVHALDTTEGFLPDLDGVPTAFPAGERFAYCNSGYVLLALLAERAAGRGFHDLVQDLVLTPAGMADTGYLRSDELPGDAGIGYLAPPDDPDRPLRSNLLHLPVRGSGDGGAYSTTADLRRFWLALFDGRVVTEQTLREMLRPRSTFPSGRYEAGLGLLRSPGAEVVQLEGYDAGVSFHSWFQPASGLTTTVIANTSEGAGPVMDTLEAALFG